MELLLVMVLVAVVLWVVGSPLRPGRVASQEAAGAAEIATLHAERDAKYREIREAEMDYRMGKLSEADWREQDRGLRREAVDILRRLDETAAPLP